MSAPTLLVRNCEAVRMADVPELGEVEFRDALISETAEGSRVSALFGSPAGREGATRLFAALARDGDGTLCLFTTVVGRAFRSITPDSPQVHLFEREIAEDFGVEPVGHPWMKPVRFPQRRFDGTPLPDSAPGVTGYFRVAGEEVHEVAVGPVHAGIIEPGHFRFQCHGEDVYHLEISLGSLHRGIERALVGGPAARTLHYMETLAGDTTVGHATAYCQAVEALSGTAAPPRAMALRGLALELERLANHAGDLGALAGDVGYLPTQSYCGRIRGDFLNATALLCGNRFGRGLVVPGGTGFDADRARASDLAKRLASAGRDVSGAVRLLWETPSVLARFEDAGRVPIEVCKALGLVGPAARASGVDIDVRRDFPSGIYRFSQVPVATWTTGDVFARAFVRWLEIERSLRFARETASSLPEGHLAASSGGLAPERLTVSLVEGWRGEICHVAVTDGAGRFDRYKVVDPSFHNWAGLAAALRGQQISDFPLCNKSFDLSYCGHDL